MEHQLADYLQLPALFEFPANLDLKALSEAITDQSWAELSFCV